MKLYISNKFLINNIAVIFDKLYMACFYLKVYFLIFLLYKVHR